MLNHRKTIYLFIYKYLCLNNCQHWHLYPRCWGSRCLVCEEQQIIWVIKKGDKSSIWLISVSSAASRFLLRNEKSKIKFFFFIFSGVYSPLLLCFEYRLMLKLDFVRGNFFITEGNCVGGGPSACSSPGWGLLYFFFFSFACNKRPFSLFKVVDLIVRKNKFIYINTHVIHPL